MQHLAHDRLLVKLVASCLLAVSSGCGPAATLEPQGTPIQPTVPAPVAAIPNTPRVEPPQPRYTIPPLRELKLHRGQTQSPAFSPDGQFVATAASQLDERIAIWNWPEGTLHNVFEVRGASGIVRVRFSEDSEMLAYSTLGRTLGVIQVSDGKRLAQHDHPRFRYYHGLHWSVDNEFVYAVANYALDHEIHRLSPRTGELQVVIPKFETTGEVGFGAFAKTPLIMSSWGDKGERMGFFALAETIDRDAPQVSLLVPSRHSITYTVVVSHDGTHFAYRADSERKVDVFEIGTMKRFGGFEVTDDQLGGFQFIPGFNSKLVSTSIRHTWSYNCIAVHDITKPADQVRKLEVHAPTTVTGLSLTRDGKLLALGFYDGEAAVWDLEAIEKGTAK